MPEGLFVARLCYIEPLVFAAHGLAATVHTLRAFAVRYGEAGLKGMGGMGGAQSGEPFTNPFDIFEQFFGGGMGGMGGGMGGFSRCACRLFSRSNNQA